MKVIFLDIHGTLTSPEFRKERDHLSIGREVDRRAVARVNRIVEATGARIVVSSDWVQHEPEVSYSEAQKMLCDHGLVAEFAGHTEQADEHTILDRGNQIQAWLDRHPSP